MPACHLPSCLACRSLPAVPFYLHVFSCLCWLNFLALRLPATCTCIHGPSPTFCTPLPAAYTLQACPTCSYLHIPPAGSAPPPAMYICMAWRVRLLRVVGFARAHARRRVYRFARFAHAGLRARIRCATRMLRCLYRIPRIPPPLYAATAPAVCATRSYRRARFLPGAPRLRGFEPPRHLSPCTYPAVGLRSILRAATATSPSLWFALPYLTAVCLLRGWDAARRATPAACVA